LKAALIAAFGRTQENKDSELLCLSGLGDRKPSGLLRHIRSLNTDPETLLRAFFLAQLPVEVRRVLAASGNKNLEELATQADRIMEAAHAEHGASIISAVKGSNPTVVSRKIAPKKLSYQNSADQAQLCFFHKKFGEAARKCRDNCPRNPLNSTVQLSSGNEQAGRSVS
jgi:hypothetical protein